MGRTYLRTRYYQEKAKGYHSYDHIDVDECTNGANDCSPNAICTNTPGGFTCVCNTGFDGTGKLCYDIDECQTQVCDVNADCENSVGSYQCTCKEGYEGSGVVCTPIAVATTGVPAVVTTGVQAVVTTGVPAVLTTGEPVSSSTTGIPATSTSTSGVASTSTTAANPTSTSGSSSTSASASTSGVATSASTSSGPSASKDVYWIIAYNIQLMLVISMELKLKKLAKKSSIFLIPKITSLLSLLLLLVSFLY